MANPHSDAWRTDCPGGGLLGWNAPQPASRDRSAKPKVTFTALLACIHAPAFLPAQPAAARREVLTLRWRWELELGSVDAMGVWTLAWHSLARATPQRSDAIVVASGFGAGVAPRRRYGMDNNRAMKMGRLQWSIQHCSASAWER